MSSVDKTSDRKAATARTYDEIVNRYDQVGPPFYARVGAALVSRLEPRHGDHVLDAGCGRGACLFAAATAIGPTGRAVGIDSSPGMVRETSAEAESRGLANVTVAVGDAEAPGFSDASFDAVLSGFVLRLLPNPQVALQAYARLLRPGGRLGATIFDSGFAGRWGEVAEVLRPFMTIGSPPLTDEFETTETFSAMLGAAGFEDVVVADDPFDIDLPDPAQWWEYLWYSGYRGMMNRIPPKDRDRARAAALKAAKTLREPDGRVIMQVTVRRATGRHSI